MKFCFKNISYKFSIIYKSYLCVINRYNEPQFYKIFRYPSQSEKEFFITVDLETFYEKKDNFIQEIASVNSNIYEILNKNCDTNFQAMQSLFQEKNNFFQVMQSCKGKIRTLEYRLKECYKILDSIKRKKISLEKNLSRVRDNLDGYSESEQSNIIENIEEEIDSKKILEDKVVKTIFEIKQNRENLILEMDKITFENTIMLNSLLTNFKKIKSIMNKKS